VRRTPIARFLRRDDVPGKPEQEESGLQNNPSPPNPPLEGEGFDTPRLRGIESGSSLRAGLNQLSVSGL